MSTFFALFYLWLSEDFYSYAIALSVEEVAFLKAKEPSFFLTLLMVTIFIGLFEARATPDNLQLTQVETHHVAELNSNQPYVAGYDVITPDLHTMKPVSAVIITISFPSVDTRYFPSGSWLGGGLFVQDQDSRFGFVDYGFYIMLVLDAADDLFLDVGLHQTRESTAPLQGPTAELLYAYTWLISGIDPSTPVTLGAGWDSDGFVHYSLVAAGFNITLPPVNVAGLLGCENIQRQFWSGDWRPGTFPFAHYVHYFQFGVVSSEIIANDKWSVKLSNPQLMKKPEGEWRSVDTAWSTQGDISYIDWDWMWGGAPYTGVTAQYYKNPLENPYELIFFYNGQTLPPGTVLWQHQSSKPYDTATAKLTRSHQSFKTVQTGLFSIAMAVVIEVTIRKTRQHRLRKQTQC